jgi:tRNA threonylcarbamoyladenosine biosynthesis protein TsaB
MTRLSLEKESIILKILALDTATSACSVAIRVDGETVSSSFKPMARGQSEVLMPMLMGVLEQAKLSVRDVDLIAVTRGPGAFTGLRIGLATARGLALASGVACCGITTTEAIADAAYDTKDPSKTLLVALDSKRADIYVQAFRGKGSLIGQPRAVSLDGLQSVIDGLKLVGRIEVVGDAQDRAMEFLKGDFTKSTTSKFTDARFVAGVAERIVLSGVGLGETSPLYLRPADAVVPKNGGRLRV